MGQDTQVNEKGLYLEITLAKMSKVWIDYAIIKKIFGLIFKIQGINLKLIIVQLVINPEHCLSGI